MGSTQNRQGYRFRDAWQALQRLRADPDETRAAFEIIEALSGPGVDKMFERFRRTAMGKQVLEEKRELLAVLQDRETLSALPEGTLGHEYVAFLEREQISAEGLVEASETGTDRYENLDEDRARFSLRLRDSHDLEHVACGYGRDLRGEAGVLTLGLAQGWNHGVGLIIAMAYVEGDAEERRLIREAWRRGRRARWLAAADWEALLSLPLDEVRQKLDLGAPPVYEPLWSAGAPAAAA
jgi:ubiquinone biosynthesis protein COQ4